MIIIRTRHDTQTNYLYTYSTKLIQEAEQAGFKVIKLEDDSVNEKVLRSRIKKQKPSLIFFNGHGNKTSIFRNKKDVFIDLNSCDVFNKTITFTRACDCLTELGKKAVDKGCYAFIGYRKKFWIARHHPRECTPLKDEVAKPIIACSDIIIKQLLHGKSVKTAVNKSYELSAKYILDLVYSKEPLAAASLQAIVTNDSSLGFEGNPDARVTS
ncbi:hypothetical protein JW851_03700 [Candidatus Woesearchaeota archaeon]|nr:hypothetical protein [Candidatus Woesearchaeota archaeon]